MFIKELPVKEMTNFLDIFEKHNEEVPFSDGDIPYELDVGLYELMESQGYLSCVCAFDEESNLAGYIILVAQPLAHHKGHWSAVTDAFYVLPQYRGTRLFRDMLDYCEDVCKRHGISAIMLGVNLNYPATQKAVERLGDYKQKETIYIKELSWQQ